MTNDTRTPDDIEREIVDERAQMSSTFDDLQKKFSVDAIMNDVGDMLRGQAGDLGRSISHTVGRNPTAVALVGVGLAWLLIGQGRQHSEGGSQRRSSDRASRQRKAAARGDWDTRNRKYDGTNESHMHDEDRSWFGDSGTDRTWYGDTGSERSRRHDGGTHSTRTDDASNGIGEWARGATEAVGNAASDAADYVGHTASDLTERLSHGLGDLSEDAKARVLSARQAAHEARLSSQEAMKKGAQMASNLFEDQPLVVGALAVAFGAAIGGALPHSRIEDDTMGDSSDRLFADAQALFREERDKAVAAAKGAASDLKGEIRDVGEDLEDLLPEGKTVGDVIVGRASDAATRVLDRATGQNEPHDRDPSRN